MEGSERNKTVSVCGQHDYREYPKEFIKTTPRTK